MLVAIVRMSLATSTTSERMGSVTQKSGFSRPVTLQEAGEGGQEGVNLKAGQRPTRERHERGAAKRAAFRTVSATQAPHRCMGHGRTQQQPD
jgi:hypothetical protein